MNSFSQTELDRGRLLQLPPDAVRRTCLMLALLLVGASQLRGYAWYSGASVGSNGTVYGWGVTDGTSYTMLHQAYVGTTLTSPKGRRISPGERSANNYYRQDVQLSFDPTDLGTYFVSSTNKIFCFALVGFIVNTVTSGSVPTPTFNVAYSSYIPVDHIPAPTNCFYITTIGLIYMGDANRGTYRTTETLQITPDGGSSGGFYQNTGQTRNYGYHSPANGSTLSQS